MTDPRDDCSPIFDEGGSSLIGGSTQAILDAINTLSQKVQAMSETQQTIAQDIAELTADAAALSTAIQAISGILSAMPVGTVVTADQKTALEAAIASFHASTKEAETLATPTPTPTPAPAA